MNQAPVDILAVDPLFPALKKYLIETTGLVYYSDKDEDLANRVHRRLLRLGLGDCASYLEVLRDSPRANSELDELIAEVTIGETYFFRHQEHFDALQQVVIPDILARKERSRSLRIWCAGCAGGPEAYSLGILLKRHFGHRLVDWEVSILGTDINRQSLARAREGKFDEWALRTSSEELRRECFVRERTGWRIAPKYKEWISFQYHNLVEHPFPSLLNNLYAFDLIVCRNVMIYFGPDLMHKMIQQFYGCLLEDSWLLVGPTEPNMKSFSAFEVVNAPGVTMYRKTAAVKTAAVAAAPALGRQPARQIAPLPVRPRVACAPVPQPGAPPVSALKQNLTDVRIYADKGDWTNALACCERLLKTNNLDYLLHFYRALVLEQTGRHAEAEAALRKSVYLDRQAVLPHYYLGLSLQSKGDPGEAARSFENALQLLESHPDSEVFKDADGITVAEMRKLARMQLEVLRA